MTEAAHQIAANPLPPGRRKPQSVGLPTGTEGAVIDPGGEPVRAAEIGEVVVRGPSVMRGYENNPILPVSWTAGSAPATRDSWIGKAISPFRNCASPGTGGSEG
jgi:acyl-CoA synthetase (AMP-forming)/AMP-acid ligase II